MQIKRLVIENFKSIERIELVEPNPFTVFVGPNGSGKSNIFEALEFWNRCNRTVLVDAIREFGGMVKIAPRKAEYNHKFLVSIEYTNDLSGEFDEDKLSFVYDKSAKKIDPEYWIPVRRVSPFQTTRRQIHLFFSRIFVNNDKLPKLYFQEDSKLNFAATNLEPVLKRILSNETIKAEIFEWLELFVPGFKAVEVDDRNELHWFEKDSRDHFTKDLISDGTYNILALLTAVYQSDQPQFLCIEEPENGLNPKVVKELVSLCRYACEEFGHFIWLNTHSQSLVSALTPEEIVLVDKVEGATQVKQIKGMNLHGLPMDEAWLSKALGGGLPW